MKTLKHLACCAGVLLATTGVSFAQDIVRPAKVSVVQESESTIRRSYPAIVLPSVEVDLSFRVSGTVIDLPVRAARSVTTGELIAQIDPRDFQQDVAQLESQVDQAVAQLSALKSGARSEEIAALEAAVESAQAQVDQAREQAERTRELTDRGVLPAAREEQDDATLRVAEANLLAQQEQLVIGRSGGRIEDVQASEAALRGLQSQLQAARDRLNDATLTAPFDGIIARRNIDNFANVQAGQSIVLLQNIANVHLAFDVPGADVTSMSANGQDKIMTDVIFDALPDQVFTGQVVEFSVQADAATQTYRGRVSVTQPKGSNILPGMVGRVIASAPGETSRLSIPLTAVASEPDGTPSVWLVDADNTVSRRIVELGEAFGSHVVVIDGLAQGDVVVSAGVSHILDGMTIRPITRVGE